MRQGGALIARSNDPSIVFATKREYQCQGSKSMRLLVTLIALEGIQKDKQKAIFTT